jgi:hypothetical protein
MSPTAIGQTSDALQHALQDDREMVLAAVVHNGYALRYANATFQGDREIVLAAVSQNGNALRFVTAALQDDRKIVLAAVIQNSYALLYASAALRDDREIVLEAVVGYGCPLHYASVALEIDSEVVRASRLGKHERGAYKVARQHGFRTSVALRMVLGGWAPCRHFIFSPTMQEAVLTVLLVAQRLYAISSLVW